MRYPAGALLSALLVSVLLPVLAVGSEAYWTAITIDPEYIVVGRLEQHSEHAFSRQYKPLENVAPSTRFYDTAVVKVEEVLWGEPKLESVPIFWLSEETFHPASSTIWCTATHCYKNGDRRIWVVWSLSERNWVEPGGFHSIQAVEMEKVAEVRAEIEKHLRK